MKLVRDYFERLKRRRLIAKDRASSAAIKAAGKRVIRSKHETTEALRRELGLA